MVLWGSSPGSQYNPSPYSRRVSLVMPWSWNIQDPDLPAAAASSPTLPPSRAPVPGTVDHQQSLLLHTFLSQATQVHQTKYFSCISSTKKLSFMYQTLFPLLQKTSLNLIYVAVLTLVFPKHLTLYLTWPWFFFYVCLCGFTGCSLYTQNLACSECSNIVTVSWTDRLLSNRTWEQTCINEQILS